MYFLLRCIIGNDIKIKNKKNNKNYARNDDKFSLEFQLLYLKTNNIVVEKNPIMIIEPEQNLFMHYIHVGKIFLL